ncbi:hypothetical protein TCAL_16758 [Tigriopus californicus]|uniref:Uncharacterized protein n=1 Tax=Tigriopus californicus TaxID=6832 RepID=A0A553PTW0_TIGCA|nr:hypothetical protein TCAL_16758 [Tigriopus californicus]
MDPGIGYKVGLELGQIHVESAVEAERGGDGRDDLGHEAVQVGVSGTFHSEHLVAQVINGLVIHEKRHVTMIQRRVELTKGKKSLLTSNRQTACRRKK